MQFSYGLSDVALTHHRHTTKNDLNGLWGFLHLQLNVCAFAGKTYSLTYSLAVER